MIASLIEVASGQTSQIVVKSGSMEPNIHIDDVLVTDDRYYSTNPIQRFDIVVFKHPADFKAVARVVGMPGETITIKENKVLINGSELKEPFQTKPCRDRDREQLLPCANFGPFKIAVGEYFLLADNRGESQDSRLFERHTISRSNILAKVTKTLSNKGRLTSGMDEDRNRRWAFALSAAR